MVRLRIVTKYGEFVSSPREGDAQTIGNWFGDLTDIASLTFDDDDGNRVIIPQAVIRDSIFVLINDDGDQ